MPELRAMISEVRAGNKIADLEFDRLYPRWARRLSEMHWTPLAVARRAAELLVVGAETRVLDVGSGVGKFCQIGALTTAATFVGVEQRESLVEIARQTALLCATPTAEFRHGNALDLDWSEFTGFFLYNPYYEHISDELKPIMGTIELSPVHYSRYVARTGEKLLSAPLGARVVTYHGFGGAMPADYRLLVREAAGTDFLEAWEKRPRGAGVVHGGLLGS